MRELLRHRIRSIMIMPEHSLKCHIFVGKSQLNIMQNEEEASGDDEKSDNDCAQFHEEEPTTPDQHLNHDSTLDHSGATSGPLYRPSAFVLSDDPKEEPRSWWAVKTFQVRENRNDTSASRFKVSAVAVKEKRPNKFCRITRFMYTVPSNVSASLETWIAVPGRATSSSKKFAKKTDNGRIWCALPDICDLKDDLERRLLATCIVITIDQRCADWFVLCQFRVTRTSAGKILCNNNEVRNIIRMDSNVAQSTEQNLQQILQSFVRTWFSWSISSEPMMRATANDSAFIASLASRDFVQCICEIGTLARKGEDCLACSPDVVALIDLHALGMQGEVSEGPQNHPASGSIKTCVPQISPDRTPSRATAAVVKCEVGESSFTYYNPGEHVGQLLHQIVVFRVNYDIYVSASEARVIYTAVVHCTILF